MFHLLNVIKNFIFHPGLRYTLPECIVVGLPMSYNNEYELQLHSPGLVRDESVAYAIPSYLPDEVREPDSRPGFTFEHRQDNTIFITFDPDVLRIWSAGRKPEEFYFTLYDKTNDIVLLNRYKFIISRGEPLR